MAKERKIRRKKPVKQTAAQEQKKIERLLGEEFDSLAEARRALKKESVPVKKPVKQTPRFNIKKATRKEKFKYAQKIGKEKYTRLLREYWEDYPDEEPGDNPYCYHGKEK